MVGRLELCRQGRLRYVWRVRQWAVGGGDTLAGTTLETTLAGTGAGQRDVCTRHTVLPHWQHCGSTHTHGVIADTTAVHTLSTLAG